MISAKKIIHAVSVKDLIEFVLRTCDLGSDRDFVGSNRALAGTRGHQQIQRSRPAGYQKEVSVEFKIEMEEFILQLRGRIDGLIITPEQSILEEIKTVAGNSWDRIADPLHWAQAKLYAFMYATEKGLEKMETRLVYLELESKRTTEFKQTFSLHELKAFFDSTFAIYGEWMQDRHHWSVLRDESIRALGFPFNTYRAGQRDLAVAAYRTIAEGGRLFLEAPTGIGKTISVLFPAIKAVGEGRLERIFYLTARTIGRSIAEKAFNDLKNGGLRFTSVTLTAKEKVCRREGQPCDMATCPLAQGYYDRRRPAMREALQEEQITRPVIEQVAQKNQVCPFALALDVSSWADAIICDYNYVFDPKVYLKRHFEDKPGDYAFLVDEAHNLVDRARDMFSADLDCQELKKVRLEIKPAIPRCARALATLVSEVRKICCETDSPSNKENDFSEYGELFEERADIVAARAFAPSLQRASLFGLKKQEDAIVKQKIPPTLVEAIDQFLKEAETWLIKNEPAAFSEQLLALYFRMHSFRRTVELFDEHYLMLGFPPPINGIKLFCLDPSALVGQVLERGKAAIFFSATLSPLDYYRSLLGGQPTDDFLKLNSPFASQNLLVLINDRIQTNFKARDESLEEVVAAIGALVQGRSGNYLVYLPSYAYLTVVSAKFTTTFTSVRVSVQRPGMNEPEREKFMEQFSVEQGTTLVGFAVLGGIFGEGIDLLGERLIGVVVVGVGLPQLNVERDLISHYFNGLMKSGFDYAYTFPGMNRVLQAVGRVIRSETDRGVVLLIDARFSETRYRRLFPAWWRIKKVRQREAIASAVDAFWNSTNG